MAVGCTVVVKPPSEAPLAAGEFLRCFVDAGLPPGVVNIVTGPGRTVGAKLVQNPLSRKIAFTGSTQTVLCIAQKAAKHLKRVTLELVSVNVNDVTDIRGPFGGRKASGSAKNWGNRGWTATSR